MSGGSYDYAFGRVDTFADELERMLNGLGADGEPDSWREELLDSMSDTTKRVLRDTLVEARILSKKMRAVEWYFSGDTGSDTMLKDIVAAELLRLKGDAGE